MAASAGSGPGEPDLGAGEEPRALSPQEIAGRLQSTRRELSNRRKILLRNLPAESSSQEIHDLLKDFELKYCYVDKHKRTAFVTLLNGEQAQDAIRLFHQHSLRGKEISLQLQPTDALLCITNLPPFYTLQEFEELVRPYGNVERQFLVYSEVTGYSKGYGFVEYMKKDSAAKARLDLLGKPLGENVLFAQWMDANQITSELIHSKCLCVENLPIDFTGDDLLQNFSANYKPVFCQLAQDEDSSVSGFAVIEYETAEQTEEVQESTDGLTINGKRVHVSYCAPGAPGRSTLATLIAAQRMMKNNRKGLLPEPNAVQIMKSLNTPAMLQMLLRHQMHGCANKLVLGAPMNVPHIVNQPVGPAFLHLNKIHQGPVFGNASNLLLQNLSHLHMAPLSKIENIQTNSKPSLLGEPPAMLLQTMLGMGPLPQVVTDMGTQGEIVSHQTPPPAAVAAGMGLLPFFPNQHVTGQAVPRQTNTQEKLPSSLGLSEGTGSASQAYLQSLTNVAAGGLQGGQLQQQSQPKNTDSSIGSCSKHQTSLLGEPPKEIHLSTNPYLNLASVLPSVCLSGAVPNKANNTQSVAASNSINSVNTQGNTPQHAVENSFNYSRQYSDYPQESNGGVYGDYGTYLQVMPSYYAATQGFFHPNVLPFTPQNPLKMAPVKNEKRSSSYLIPNPEDSRVEYVGPDTQGSGMHYTELYLKRKRVY
ncbi:ribonucleoprotein PTB-binding 2 isoform X2 [Erythrolamprus reginae]|uniref:ribonucleoprotein PTB-binding 2 isoform X2 n=1 Tax=Erythrolamprus reginae TaxID=121349 RepID=UPI00396C8895